MNKVITLTIEASKRLVAKAVVTEPDLQKAYKLGYIGLSLSTTCGYIIEELCGYKIACSRYCNRYISSKGFCLLSPEEQIGFTLFVSGEMVTAKIKKGKVDYNGNIQEYLGDMGPSDVWIKSGNIMDSTGKVAYLVGSQVNGKVDELASLPENVYSIIPMIVSKTIPGKVDDLIKALENEKITKTKCAAEPTGMIVLEGKVVTEIEAAKKLLKVDMLPIAFGGFGSNRSSTTFLLSGEEKMVNNAYAFLDNLNKEPALIEVENIECEKCSAYTLFREKSYLKVGANR